jgi:hypothetical protein
VLFRSLLVRAAPANWMTLAGQHDEYYKLNLDGTGLVQLTAGDNGGLDGHGTGTCMRTRNATASPDGAWIALREQYCNVISTAGGVYDVLRGYPVKALATDGSGTIKLLYLARDVMERAYSLEWLAGSRAVVLAPGFDAYGDVYLASLDGGLVNLTLSPGSRTPEWQPSVSADGAWVAYVSKIATGEESTTTHAITKIPLP